MRRILPIFLIAALVSGLIYAPLCRAQDETGTKPQDPEVKVEVVGLSIAKGDPNDKFDRSVVRGLPRGTALHFAITDKTRFFTRFEKESAKIELFTDQKGTDLLKPSALNKAKMGLLPSVSDDHHTAMFSMTAPQTPAPGAKEIHFRGKVVVETGVDEKTEEQKRLLLKEGSEITVGPCLFKIKNIQAFGENNLQITLTSDKSHSAIKTIEFIGADGKKIKTRKTGQSSVGWDKNKTYDLYYSLTKEKEKGPKDKTAPKGAEKMMSELVTVRITYFTKVDKLEVPIDVKVGLGL
ncbi:MAG TPA: hypothetical protein ENH84_07660 [Phycisphaerae bacterium]|nr:hypothetical protein [Phycisphaerae bacterium]